MTGSIIFETPSYDEPRKAQAGLTCLHQLSSSFRARQTRLRKWRIISNLELFLNYCTRFYERQFITRENVHKGILELFEHLLNGYFQTDTPQTIGLPSVAHCAGELNLSPGYFGDLIKKETGKTAQEYIQSKVIDLAKERIFDYTKSVSLVAYELGFKYPQHFTRLFKQQVGDTPKEYRNALN